MPTEPPKPPDDLSNGQATASETLIRAAQHLKLPADTFAPLFSESSFLVVMRMATTIEPILNDALETRIYRMQNADQEGPRATHVAEFVRRERQFSKKVKLALDLGVLTQEDHDFVDALMLVRNHYAHHVRNLPLGLIEAAERAAKHNNRTQLEAMLLGPATAGMVARMQEPVVRLEAARLGIIWMFASFLASALDVIRPKPITLAMDASEASDTAKFEISNPASSPLAQT